MIPQNWFEMDPVGGSEHARGATRYNAVEVNDVRASDHRSLHANTTPRDLQR